jgi:Fe-S cluster assembly protein SufD
LISANATEPVVSGNTSAGQAESALDRILAAVDNPDWLIERRRKALETFDATPLPDRAAHLWRYTDPAHFMPPDGPNEVVASVPQTEPTTVVLRFDRRAVAGVAVCRNGSLAARDLDPEIEKAGVIILDLNEAAREFPEIVRKHLGSLIDADFGKFEALANALWGGGLFIYVPKNVDVTKPIHISNSSTPDGGALFQRHLVVAEENTSLTLVDDNGQGNGDTGNDLRTTTMAELIAGAQARLKFVTIQNWDRRTVSYMTQRAHLAAGARLDTVMTSLGGRISKVDCGATLAGQGAESNIFALAVGSEEQHFDHHTVHDHTAGSTHSDLHFKIAVRDRANSVYTGLIRIDEDAPFCEAYQENRNLILSPKARVETIPELEIMNNEVRCSHGATVGKVNPEEIFYLESRGIDRADAIRLIVTGFVGPILDHIPEYTRERLHDTVLERLGAK